ncbi:MAG: hypothetical protein ACI8RZ_005091, partial [Myxococcota bacterium]
MDPHSTEKAALFTAFRDRLTDQLEALTRTRQAAQAGTRVDGTHRPATRGERGAVTSQGYLALGLAKRITDLSNTLALLGRIPPEPRTEVAPGALLTLGDGRRILVLPGGQGTKLSTPEGPITVLSPTSPLIRAL